MLILLALDVGDKRVGLASGTREPAHAAPLATVPRAEAEDKILALIKERQIGEVVVGLPLSEDGAFNEQCNKIEKFCIRLQKRCNARFIMVDEYASTLEAQDKLRELKNRGAKRGSVELDSYSAALILEGYLHNPHAVIKTIDHNENSEK